MRVAKTLRRAARERGITIVEQAVGLAVTALLLAIGLPNYSEYVQNRHIRTAAESIIDGLQLARIEAVRRNDLVEFRFNAGNWSVVATDSGEVIQTRSAAESANASVDVAAGSVSGTAIDVRFNGLGRITSGNASSVFNIHHARGASACGPSGYRCMRVQMTSGGLARMCDAQLPAGDPQACS